MKEIIEFLKQRRNIKYSIWIIVFGLIFVFSFQANKAQIFQILEKPIRIVPGTKEAKQYQVSGWHGSWAKGEKSILRLSLPEEKNYQMVIRAFSCSPPGVRDQMAVAHFNNVALDRLKFRKTPKWQEFKINIHSYLLKEANAIKFVYTQDTRLSPIAFDSLEFRNYAFKWGGLHLLFDLPAKRINYLNPQVSGYSFGFAILLLFFWLFYSRFLSFTAKMKFFRAIRIDLWSYLPSVILFLGLALFSLLFSYHFVYSLKTFFILALAPTAVLKFFPYKNLLLRLIIKPVFRFILRDIEKTCPEIKRAYLACLSFFPFLKRQITTFRRFLIRYHKTNLSSAFILDFMLLLVLCALLLMAGLKPLELLGEQVANLAYFLLVMGVVIKAVQFFKESR